MSGSKEGIIAELESILRIMDSDLPLELPLDDEFVSWGFESMDHAEFIARVEQRYNMEIPDDIWDEMISLSSTANYLIGRLHER